MEKQEMNSKAKDPITVFPGQMTIEEALAPIGTRRQAQATKAAEAELRAAANDGGAHRYLSPSCWHHRCESCVFLCPECGAECVCGCHYQG